LLGALLALGLVGVGAVVEGVLAEGLAVLAGEEVVDVLGRVAPGDLVDDALAALLGVERGQVADEDDDGAAVGEGLLDELADGAPGGVVVGAEVGLAAALGGVVIDGQQAGLLGDLVEVGRLVLGVDDADGEGVDLLVEQGVDDLLLLAGVALGGP